MTEVISYVGKTVSFRKPAAFLNFFFHENWNVLTTVFVPSLFHLNIGKYCSRCNLIFDDLHSENKTKEQKGA